MKPAWYPNAPKQGRTSVGVTPHNRTKMSTQRYIKFRAWHKGEAFMIEWDFIIDDGILPYFSSDSYVLMQYTGLKDRNGREIYEGDVVKFNMGGEDFRRPVAWNPQGFWTIHWQDGLNTGPLRGTYEVVGNIYDNTEMTAR